MRIGRVPAKTLRDMSKVWLAVGLAVPFAIACCDGTLTGIGREPRPPETPLPPAPAESVAVRGSAAPAGSAEVERETIVAQHLLKTVTAIRLMGADCIISGIRPQIAQTIVHLGIDLQGITTKATLADALSIAIRRSGWTVSKSAAAS